MNVARKLISRSVMFTEAASRSQVCRFLTSSRFDSDKNKRNNLRGLVTVRKNQCSTVSISKKRPTKKKKSEGELAGLRMIAFSTAEEYDLESLSQKISDETQFSRREIFGDSTSYIDAVHAVRKEDNSETENQHLFFFREGSVVMWNLTETDVQNILKFIKTYEKNSFDESLIQSESETMTYLYAEETKTGIINDNVVFSKSADLCLEKFAISNAMALSVHLGCFEANLERYIDTMEPVTEDLKSGRVIKMSRHEVLQKTGQLFALRHNINLNSDLLDTPDIYWDRADLESLYQKTFNYFCINKRTRVMNEKINHCIELVHLLSSHLSDKHHVRLEWMIIILIMVEVVFEVLHFSGR